MPHKDAKALAERAEEVAKMIQGLIRRITNDLTAADGEDPAKS